MIADDIAPVARAWPTPSRGEPGAGVDDAGAQHHDVPLRAGRSSATPRRTPPVASVTSNALNESAARPAPARRRGVRLERRRRRPLRAARVHRELPHDAAPTSRRCPASSSRPGERLDRESPAAPASWRRVGTRPTLQRIKHGPPSPPRPRPPPPAIEHRAAEQARERRHAAVGDAARHDQTEVTEVGGRRSARSRGR